MARRRIALTDEQQEQQSEELKRPLRDQPMELWGRPLRTTATGEPEPQPKGLWRATPPKNWYQDQAGRWVHQGYHGKPHIAWMVPITASSRRCETHTCATCQASLFIQGGLMHSTASTADEHAAALQLEELNQKAQPLEPMAVGMITGIDWGKDEIAANAAEGWCWQGPRMVHVRAEWGRLCGAWAIPFQPQGHPGKGFVCEECALTLHELPNGQRLVKPTNAEELTAARNPPSKPTLSLKVAHEDWKQKVLSTFRVPEELVADPGPMERNAWAQGHHGDGTTPYCSRCNDRAGGCGSCR